MVTAPITTALEFKRRIAESFTRFPYVTQDSFAQDRLVGHEVLDDEVVDGGWATNLRDAVQLVTQDFPQETLAWALAMGEQHLKTVVIQLVDYLAPTCDPSDRLTRDSESINRAVRIRADLPLDVNVPAWQGGTIHGLAQWTLIYAFQPALCQELRDTLRFGEDGFQSPAGAFNDRHTLLTRARESR